jgi:FkbM family methyltransferase
MSNNIKAQLKQDIILDENFFKGKKDGFFVEVGALDGISGSNTYFFEKERNWSGILIEPNPIEFKKLLDCDRTLSKKENCAIFSEEKDVEFLSIEGPCNVLIGIIDFYDSRHIERINRELKMYENYPIGHEYYSSRELIKVKGLKLQTLLDKYEINHIDLLSIDVEGAELQVLESIDYNKTTVDCILLENNYGIDKEFNFLVSKGFKVLGNIEWDVVFIKNN